MSVNIYTFVENVDDSLIPNWLGMLEEHGMKCEIHPDFSFTDQVGFLPFKLKLNNPVCKDWANKSFLTGFEFYLDGFDLHEELEKINPAPTFLSKLLGAKKSQNAFVTPEIDKNLESCKQVLCFRWGAGDTFMLRMATMSSGILAKIANGQCTYELDEWYENEGLIAKFSQEADDFESILKPREHDVHEFDGWQ